jgi:hypothetical protein
MNDKKLMAEVETIGVVNPYALVDLIEGESLDWDEMDVEEADEMLEAVLGSPTAELFDPQFDSPLYAGLTVTDEGLVERVSVESESSEHGDGDDVLDPDVSFAPGQEGTDVTASDGLPADVRELVVGSSQSHETELTDGGVKAEPDVAVEGMDGPATVETPSIESDADLDVEAGPMAATESDDERASSDLELSFEVGWEPRGIDWVDAGEFFRQGAEQFDPVQGAVGDCYLIAALSAVGWANPAYIRHTALADTEDHTSYIGFFDGSRRNFIRVSERIPVREGSNSLVYARSAEGSEMWPAVYEKAYAKWKTGATDDKPEIPRIAGGDPVRSCAELTGKGRQYFGTAGRSGDQLWDIVRGNSRGAKTFRPMTAWTYPSSAAAPSRIDYGSARIVANHAYTVLGWKYTNGKKYIVLRNPWGRHEATVGTVGGSYTYSHDGAWKSIPLSTKGVFAIDADVFKRYFAGIGVSP